MPWPFSRKKSTEPDEETEATKNSSAIPAQQELPNLYQTRASHANVPYLLPNDADEINRLEFQHHILRSLLKANTLVQLDHPKNILDVGCGTGIWGHEMAEEFPESQVVGMDLEHVARPGAPHNYMFVQGNVLENIPFPAQHFDFVHMRFLINAIPQASWPDVMQRLYTVLRPNGYIELLEAGGDPFRPGGQACATMFEGIMRIAATHGIDPREMYRLGNYAAMVGFVDVQSRSIEVPIGNWGGRTGTMMATDMIQGMKAFKEPMQKMLGYTSLQFDELCNIVIQEWEDYHSTYTLVAYIARKVSSSSPLKPLNSYTSPYPM